MDWLQRIPIALVDAHRVMMPRLQARESMRAAHVSAIGSGHMAEGDRKATLHHWEREANGTVAAPKVAKATPAVLSAMGIDVAFEPVGVPT